MKNPILLLHSATAWCVGSSLTVAMFHRFGSLSLTMAATCQGTNMELSPLRNRSSSVVSCQLIVLSVSVGQESSAVQRSRFAREMTTALMQNKQQTSSLMVKTSVGRAISRVGVRLKKPKKRMGHRCIYQVQKVARRGGASTSHSGNFMATQCVCCTVYELEDFSCDG